MTKIVGIHGVGNYHYLARAESVATAAREISHDWERALDTGLAAVSHDTTPRPDLQVAYYSHVLHRGTAQGDFDPGNLDEDAQDLLIAWVEQLIPRTTPQTAQGTRTARARGAADWLSHHLGDKACRAALIFCREASIYLSHPTRRQAVREAVAETVATHQPEVIIAHSLGTVVAYETLWQNPQLKTGLLLTLGSPLGIPGAIFDRLDPPPSQGRGARPPTAAAWANLADVGDIVAVPHSGLSRCFDGIYHDDPAIIIDERSFHGVQYYLASHSTAQIILPYIMPTSQDD